MRHFGLGLAVAVMLAPVSVLADLLSGPLPEPQGEVVLTVAGDIGRTNEQGEARFDMAMLEGLATTTFLTRTIWTEGVQEFAGVSLRELLEALEARGQVLTAIALNEYSIDLPVDEVGPDGPIIAFRHNGEAMSVRQKGPLWVVYPYDAKSEFRSEVVYARSIWQLVRIEVHD